MPRACASSQPLLERLALEQLEHEVREALRAFSPFEQAHTVGVLEGAGEGGLEREALAELRIGGGQELPRHATEGLVLGQPHRRDAPRGEGTDEAHPGGDDAAS